MFLIGQVAGLVCLFEPVRTWIQKNVKQRYNSVLMCQGQSGKFSVDALGK